MDRIIIHILLDNIKFYFPSVILVDFAFGGISSSIVIMIKISFVYDNYETLNSFLWNYI